MHGNPCCMSFRNQDKDGYDVHGSHEACFCRCELNWVQSRFVPVKGREKDTDPWKNANAAPCDRCKWNWMTGPFAEQACAAVQDEPIHHGGTYGYDSPNLKCGPGTRYVPDAEDLLTDAVINKCSPECTICKEGNCNIDGTPGTARNRLTGLGSGSGATLSEPRFTVDATQVRIFGRQDDHPPPGRTLSGLRLVGYQALLRRLP